MTPVGTLVAAGLLIGTLVDSHAAEEALPPIIELRTDDPLVAALAKRFPEKFAGNPDQLTLKLQPGGLDPAPAAARAKLPAHAATVPPGLAALAGFRGKKGRTDNNVISATRAGNQADIKVVALSPGDEGVTVRAQPSLWWFQSGTSEEAEIEFILTEIAGRRPEELLRVPLKAMPRGFNSLSLASPALNPGAVTLRPGATYQWTIAVRGEESGSAVYAKLRRVELPALETAALTSPAEPATIRSLSDSGNWYELFDIVSRLARRFPRNQEATATRTTLLDQAGLSPLIRD